MMCTNSWDFNYEGSISSAINSMDSTMGMDGGGSSDDGLNRTQTILHGPSSMSLIASDASLSSDTVQGGLEGAHMKDSLLQLRTIPSLQLSSNHLLAAAKWFQQKKLQKALTASGMSPSSTDRLQVGDHVQPCTHGVPKISSRNILEGSGGVGDNGSRTTSFQDSLLSPSVAHVRNSLSFSEGLAFPCSKEQTEHQSVFFQARPEFYESVLDPFDRAALEVTQIRDAMWQSHPQVPHRVLVPAFANHRGFNRPQDTSEGMSSKNKPRVRARRGQATDPHSIAERLRRERIAERMKMLQELVPNTNKIDRAIMLDEVIDYVKFLVIQLKILSMSRLGGAGLVVPLVGTDGKSSQALTAAQSETSGPDSMLAIEEHVARLMTHNVGAALQFLQRKGLCLMPISMTEGKLGADPSLSLANQGSLLDQSNPPAVTGLCTPMQT